MSSSHHDEEPHPSPPFWHVGAFLTKAGCDELRTHKYVAGAYTALDLLLNPWWLWVASWVPAKVSPNGVTTLGSVAVLVMLCVTLAVRHGPEEAYENGHVVLLLSGLSVFFYQTMDAVDGKHARNTGQSTALGALYDHGCDAVVMLLGALLVETSTSLPSLEAEDSRLIVGPLGCLLPLLSFHVAQWEHYVTGKMEHIGVSEAQFCVMGTLLTSSIFGPRFFWLDVLAFLPGPLAAPLRELVGGPFGMPVKRFLAGVTVVFAMTVILMSLVRVIRVSSKGIWSLGTLSPVFAHLVLGCVFFAASPPMYSENRLLCFAVVGTGIVDLNIRMIIAGVCRVRFPPIFPVMGPFAVLVVAGVLGGFGGATGCTLLWATLVWQGLSTTLVSGHAISLVCAELNIPFLAPLPGATKKAQ